MKLSTIITSDTAVLTRSIKTICEKIPRILVIDTVKNFEDCLKVSQQGTFDLVLFDADSVHMPDESLLRQMTYIPQIVAIAAKDFDDSVPLSIQPITTLLKPLTMVSFQRMIDLVWANKYPQSFVKQAPLKTNNEFFIRSEGGFIRLDATDILYFENVGEYEKSKKTDNHKRKALILVSDGEDRNSYYNEKQLFDLLRESEVQIYVIGFVSELSKDGGFISKSPQEKSKAFLQRLATETGGKAYFPGSAAELPALAKEISNELRTQYSIGYIPSNDARDGSYRNIKVAVEDGPNKEKRIAISRAGRTAEANSPPNSPKPTPAVKNP